MYKVCNVLQAVACDSCGYLLTGLFLGHLGLTWLAVCTSSEMDGVAGSEKSPVKVKGGLALMGEPEGPGPFPSCCYRDKSKKKKKVKVKMEKKSTPSRGSSSKSSSRQLSESFKSKEFVSSDESSSGENKSKKKRRRSEVRQEFRGEGP